MTPAAAPVPTESDVLCEHCGYTLNGLPPDGRCPECGEPVAESLQESGRTLTAWETERHFFATTADVVLRPAAFYRHLRTRVDAEHETAAGQFAAIHWLVTGLLAAAASFVHYFLTASTIGYLVGQESLVVVIPVGFMWVTVGGAVGATVIWATTRLAAWLTTWEAGWRGYRLPRAVVLRGLHYHAAHLVPVAAGFLLVTAGYRLLVAVGVADFTSLVTYLIVLSVVVVVGLFYLFWTYWIGMKNMLYANV